MDKPLKLVMVAALALVILYVLSTGTLNFQDKFVGFQQDNSDKSECALWKERTQTAGTSEVDKWEQKYNNNCEGTLGSNSPSSSGNPTQTSGSQGGSGGSNSGGGQSSSSYSGEKLHLVAVPYNIDDATFKQTIQNGMSEWLQKSPLRETSNPREHVKISYMDPSEVDDSSAPSDLCELNDHVFQEVLDSKYSNDFNIIMGVTGEDVEGLGCSEGKAGAMKANLPGTFTHELGHMFTLGHTKDHTTSSTKGAGCGAERGSNEPNDRFSDGPGEIMNYCPGDEFFSTGSDEYSILKEELQRWM